MRFSHQEVASLLHLLMTITYCREHLAISHEWPHGMSSVVFQFVLRNCYLNVTLVYLTFPTEKAMGKPTHGTVHSMASSGKTHFAYFTLCPALIPMQIDFLRLSGLALSIKITVVLKNNCGSNGM